MRFWLTLFIILILVLDLMWMLDGLLNMQYGEILQSDSYTNQHTTFAYRFFSDKPLMNLYYRIIVSLLVFILIIMAFIFLGRLSNYRSLLDASNLKYRSLFMGMQTGFALRKILRNPDGTIKDIRFLEVNPAFRQHTGLGNIEILDKSISDVFKDTTTDLIDEYDKISRRGGTFTKIHQAKGLDKVLRITAYQHAEDVFATLVEDITREKNTEDQLTESLQLKSILLDTIHEGVYFIDPHMNILWANKKILDLTNKEEKDIIGSKCFQIWYDEDQKCQNCPIDLSKCDSRPRSITLQSTFTDDKFLQIFSNPVFDADSLIKGFVITVFDLTDWKNAVDKLTHKQQQLKLALEAAKMTTWEWNTDSEEVTIHQPQILTSNPDNSYNLQQILNYIHPEDRANFSQSRQKLLSGEVPKLSLELRIKSKSQNWVWFKLVGNITETGIKGQPQKVIGVTYDINKLKTLSINLENANHELTSFKNKLEIEVEQRIAELRDKDLLMIRQSRQAAMGEMIGNIAHQWRQPLNSIGVVVQDLLDAWDFDELNRDYLENKIDLAMSIIRHMSQTIDDFRDFFSPDNQPQKFDLHIQISKTVNILKDMYVNQGIEIVSDLQPASINSYPREFSQVLINILNNAKDALIAQKVKKPRILLSLTSSKDDFVIKVEDNAGGISFDIIDKIFDPYFTTKHESNGTGVGLYMSKNIIEKHMNGKISAQNTGQGALFTITLPRN